jgi:hypothetical protein
MTIATTIVAMSQRDCLVLPTAEYLWEANSSKSFFLLLIMRAGFDLDAPRACSHREKNRYAMHRQRRASPEITCGCDTGS